MGTFVQEVLYMWHICDNQEPRCDQLLCGPFYRIRKKPDVDDLIANL
jgi:hypothetical protein